MESKLSKGDKAPSFELLNQNKEVVKLEDLVGKKVFVYFYPRANTPGCTTQACEIRDSKSDLSNLGVTVVGISNDTPLKQLNFDNKNTLNFPLLCDEDHAVSENYGVWAEKKLYGKVYMGLVRSSFLIDENGIILQTWYKVSPKKTVPEVMKYLNN